eukprot:6188303-Pleurochrysis_carterae.AAC.1
MYELTGSLMNRTPLEVIESFFSLSFVILARQDAPTRAMRCFAGPSKRAAAGERLLHSPGGGRDRCSCSLPGAGSGFGMASSDESPLALFGGVVALFHYAGTSWLVHGQDTRGRKHRQRLGRSSSKITSSTWGASGQVVAVLGADKQDALLLEM